MSNRVIIFDTTLRDGEQSPGATMNLQEKLRMARQLESLGVDVIEAGFPASSVGDFEAVHAIANAVTDVQVAALARCNKNDIDNLMHFMGSIHALEHASIGLMPLMVMADRNDFGGISTPMHAQLGLPAVFVYDGLPGGAGLCRSAFPRLAELFAAVRDLLRRCPCELGCPSCVHSPKCGSGNRPIDKAGALFLLERLIAAPPPEGDMLVSGLEPETRLAQSV